MATQLSIIRGDTFPTQTITVTSDSLDFANKSDAKDINLSFYPFYQ